MEKILIGNERGRMRRALLIGTAAALAAAALPLSAQKPGLGFGLSVGANVPNGTFAEGANTGLVATGFLSAGSERFGVRGELFWSRSDLDSPLIRRVGDDVLPSGDYDDLSGDIDLIGGAANIVFPLTQSVIRPYLIGGVGVYRRRVAQDIGGTIEEFRSLRDTQTDVGYNGGLGLAFGGGAGVGIFVEARYHSVNTSPERTRFVPIVIGLSF
jgi:hypothetical protein